jgi:rod shape-determining protein MreD
MGARAREILRPASARFITATLAGALLLNLLPWGGALLLARPDFAALAVLHWNIREPRKIGIGAGWAMGLVMDVADGVVFGQHALAYTIASFIALKLHRRIQRFSPWEQALHILVVLLLLQGVILLIQLSVGAPFPGIGFFAASFTGAALWPALLYSLELPQRKPPKNEPVYPGGHKGAKGHKGQP